MKNERLIYSDLGRIRVLGNIKELVIRNNKIMVDRPHTHPEGLFPNPKGLLTHFKGLQVASNMGLNTRKRSPRQHNNKHPRGAPQRA